MREMLYRSLARAILICALGVSGLVGYAQPGAIVSVQSEDFNGCSLPSGWQNNIIVGNRDWEFTTVFVGVLGGSMNGSCTALFDDDAAGPGVTNHAELVAPSVNVNSYATVTLEFNYNNEVFGSHTFQASVWDGSQWVVVFTVTGNDPPGVFGQNTASVDVSAYKNANFSVKYEYIDAGAWSWGIGVDNHELLGQIPYQYDAKVTNNLGAMEYTKIPLSQTPIDVIATAENIGTDTITNVVLSTSMDDGITFLSQSSAPQTLAPGESFDFVFPGGFTPPNPGVWSIQSQVFIAEPDGNMSNNTTPPYNQEYTDIIYSRDDEFSTFAYGIGGVEGSMGNEYLIHNLSAASGIEVQLGDPNNPLGFSATPTPGSEWTVALWDFDSTLGVPGSKIAESNVQVTASSTPGQVLQVDFATDVLLQPGVYIATIEEPAANPNVAIGKTDNIYAGYEDKIWIRFPTNPFNISGGWSHVSPFPAQFVGTPMVRLLFSTACVFVNAGRDTTVCVDEPVTLGGDPTAALGQEPYTYSWFPTAGLDDPTSPNPTWIATSNVDSPFTYPFVVTVMDDTGCAAMDTVLITVNPKDTAALFLPTTDYCISDPPDTIDFQPPGGVLDGPGVGVIGTTTSLQPLVYDNGPLVNSPGTGAGGADESRLQNVSLGMNIYGFGHQQPLGLRIADDFDATPYPSVTIDSIAFFAYQTGSPTTSTITGVSLQIWDGDPAAGGSNVVFGDPTTNQMISTEFAEIYRTLEGGGATNRPIMRNVVDVGGLNIPPGVYWFDWATSGTLGSGPWIAPITINGQTATGNAQQFFGGWGPAIDIGQQGMPYILYGQALQTTQVYGFDPGAAGVGTHILTYCYTNEYDCTFCDTFEVTVHPLPDATIDSLLPLCSNEENIFLSAATPLGVWSGPGIVDPLTGEFDPSQAGPGVHTIIYNVMDANGCENSDSIQIRVHDVPTADAGLDTTICEGESVFIGGNPTFTAGSDPINGFLDSYAWTPQFTLSSSTDANPLATPTATTNYVVTVQDNNGCIDRDTVTVTVLEGPVADAGQAVYNSCNGAPVVIGGNPSASQGTPPYSYSWSPAIGLSSTTSPNPTANPPVDIEYTLTVTDANGCTDEATVEVRVVNGPVANAGVDIEVCSDVDVTLGGVPTAAGGNPPYTYDWSPATGLSNPNVANPVFNATNFTALPVPYSFTVTVTDQYGCEASDVIEVTLMPAVIVDAGTDREICWGKSTKLGGVATATNGVPPYSYTWGPTVGLITPHVSNPVATPTSSTIYTVQVEDDNGCIGEDDVTVIVNPLPIAEAGPDHTICKGTTVQIGGQPTANGGLAPYTYSWSPYIGLSDDNVPNPLAGPSVTETFTLTVTDSKGCQDIDVVTVFVVENPKAAAGKDKSICLGATAELGAKPAASNGQPPYNYKWDGPYLDNNMHENPVATPPKAESITYYLTVWDANNCKDVDSMVLTVNPLPKPTITNLAQPQDFCINDQIITLNGNPSGGIYSGPGVSGSTFNPGNAGIGQHEITYTYTDSNGCTGTVSYVVSVHGLPIIYAGPDKTVYLGHSTTLDAVSGGNYTYIWDPIDFLDDPTALNPNVILPTQTTTYTITATDAFGCERSDEVTVFVDFNTPLDIANTFSPNGDGINDTWVIPDLDFFTDNRVEVYNRWGQLVFERDNYSNADAWDGDDLPEGTYFYVITLDLQGDRTHRGTVTIVR